jgi:hypothetical protein
VAELLKCIQVAEEVTGSLEAGEDWVWFMDNLQWGGQQAGGESGNSMAGGLICPFSWSHTVFSSRGEELFLCPLQRTFCCLRLLGVSRKNSN